MKRFILTILALTLGLASIGHAQKGGISAAQWTTGVAYTASKDTAAWGDFAGTFQTRTTHTVKIITGNYPAQFINVTVCLTQPGIELIYSQAILTSGYLGQSTYTVGDSAFFNYTWNLGSSQVFSDTTAILSFTINGGLSPCEDSVRPVIIHFAEHSDASHTYLNACSGDSGIIVPQTFEGGQYYLPPNADLGVLQTTDTVSKKVVDHGIVGDQTIHVPIYVRDLTFNYYDSFHVVIGWDSDLQYKSFTKTNEYTYFASVDTSTNQVTVRNHGGWYCYAENLPATNALFGTLNLAIKNTATEGESLKVYIKGNSYYAGCFPMYDIDSSNPDTALVTVDYPDVTLKVGNASMTVGNTNVAVPLMVLTNVPLKMNSGTGVVPLAFLGDLRHMDNTSYVKTDSTYTYDGGVLKWKGDSEYPYMQFHENQNSASTVNISPSEDWQVIGTIRVNANSVGVDTIFGVGDDELDYVTVEYTSPNGYVLTWDDSLLKVANGILTVNSSGGGGGGCPALFAHDGNDFKMEDFILTTSQNKQSPQNDFLPLQTTLLPINGKYRLSVREFENEITYLNQAELIAVDHPVGTSVGISTDGRVFGRGENLLPLAAETRAGEDVLPLVGLVDGNKFVTGEPGAMTITYRNPYPGESGHIYIVVSTTNEKPPIEPGTELASETDDIYTEIEDADGVWHYLGGIPPRDYTTLNSQTAFDSKSTKLGETFRVRITWQRQYEIDCQMLQLDAGLNVAEYRLAPSDAVHSAAGKVSSKLGAMDDQVTTITPGESVELSFDAPPIPAERGFTRTFFFHSYGYYKRFSGDGALPTQFALNGNYPNPFNPSTTIRFSLPAASQVQVVVYNMLGQEVKTLFDGALSAGDHDLIWNGDDNSGRKVSSGVYLYRMTAPGFEQTKKMTLIK